MTDIAIRVENLGKRYQLGPSKSGSFRESLSNLFKTENGKRKTENGKGKRETGKNDPSSGLPSPVSDLPSSPSHPEDQPVTSHSESQPSTFNQDFWALQDINFEIKRGEAVGIIGRNGAGKSTLLKILSRITEPTKGRFEIFGRVSSLLEVGTGFHPELTGRENVYLNGTILGMKRREVKAKFDEIIAFSGVEKFIDTPVKHYSSGMQVRLAFAVAAHLEPEILIIDEVLAVGDAEFQKKCLGKMEDVTGEGRTVLFVSHDMNAISTLTKKCVVLEKGTSKFIGETHKGINFYLDSSQSQPGFYIDDRTCSSKPYVKRIQIYTNLPSSTQTNGESIEMEFIISTPIPITGASFSFQITDNKGRKFIHLWVFDHEKPFCREEGEHTLRCIIPNLKLYMGKYYLKTYLTEPPGGEVFQVLENICPFEVVMFGKNRQFQFQPDSCAYTEEAMWEVGVPVLND